MRLLIIDSLCLWHNHWLMVGGRSHSTETVKPRRETINDRRAQSAIAVTIIVNSLEECEDVAWEGLVGSETIPECLNGNLRRLSIP